jgi:flagellin-like hook-associated protein FlgL
MSSILTNMSAMSAVTSLKVTQAALSTTENQLGVQALSVANQTSQLILKLFQ